MPAVADVEENVRAACAGERWEEAVTLALAGYGAELMSYLVALHRSRSDADDAFGLMAEKMWKSLPAFRWESSLRTWAYTLARHAASRVFEEGKRHARAEPLSNAQVEAAVAAVRSRTATFLRTETKDKLDSLRAELAPDDQTLLILRVNRKMEWREIADVMAQPGDDGSRESLDRRAASLRKRYERIKADLRRRLQQRGGNTSS